MVVDTSIILAILLNEKLAPWALGKLKEHRNELIMSTVNLAEALIRSKDLIPSQAGAIEKKILGSKIKFIPVSVNQAKIAAAARLQFPINLGDCFTYALAKDTQKRVLTLDSDFLKTDAVIEPIPEL
jgi:ribonuclease VapC